MKTIIFFVLFLIGMIGCTPSPEAIEKVLAQTQTAIALLSTNTPTITNTPTETSTPTPTNTPEPTFTPTPDLRVIEGYPQDFQLKPEDLPKESQFWVYDAGRHINQEVIGEWGVDEGRIYLERTKRVEGFWTQLLRGSEVLTAPWYVYCNIVEYETTEGARISLTDYNVIAYPDRSSGAVDFFQAKENFPNLGDSRIAYYADMMASSGEMWMEYNVEATYYNYLIHCFGYGRKVEVKPDYVANVVQKIIDKLKAAPLILP